MRTNRTVSQDSISSEIIAMFADTLSNTEWAIRWLDALHNSSLSPNLLQYALDTHLCTLFDDAPVTTIERSRFDSLRVVRVEFRLTELYHGLSALRRCRKHMRATLQAERDTMSPEVQLICEDTLDDLEHAIAGLKQIQRYVASIDLTRGSSIIALGGDPGVPAEHQELVLYALQSTDGHYFFSDLQTQAWMQDFYVLTRLPENRSAVSKYITWLHHNLADQLALFGVPQE